MARTDGRGTSELRSIKLIRNFTSAAPGSVLIRWGRTQVLCTACWQVGVPKWREGSGLGWLTAEYDMLPGSTGTRKERSRLKVDGRTQEIQRLVGRVLRGVVELSKLGENTIQVDCDVLEADGGTRCAAITGAWVALVDAVRVAQKKKLIGATPITSTAAAVSVGRVKGKILLDLDYREDVNAEVDLNVAMTGEGRFVEVQGTGEEATFSGEELRRMLSVAQRGIKQIFDIQQRALRQRGGGMK